jgi:ribonuclease J
MCGIPKENTFVLKNGDVLSINKGIITQENSITANEIYVDGNRIGDVGSAVIKDRKIMASDGIVVVIANIDTTSKELLGKPNITTRGFVLVNENEILLKKLEEISKKAILAKLNSNLNYSEIKNEIIGDLSTYIYTETGRKPIILPVIMNIKKAEKVNA